MFIDRNGKLFGKVSIVDIVIVLAVLAVAGVFFIKPSAPKPVVPPPQAQEDEVLISFFTKEIASKHAEKIKVGDPVKEKKNSAVIGYIKDIILEDTLYYGFDTEGKAVASTKPGYKSVTMVVAAKGQYSANETYINNTDFYKGKELAVTTGRIALWSKVIQIENTQK